MARVALDSDLVTGQIFFVSGKNPLLTREPAGPDAPVVAMFGTPTEIQEEIIARCLGL